MTTGLLNPIPSPVPQPIRSPPIASPPMRSPTVQGGRWAKDSRCRARRMVRDLSFANFAAAVGLLLLICGVSERWWVSAALTFLPRTPYLVPSVVLLPCACRWHRLSIATNLLAGGVILLAIVGYRIPLAAAAVPPNQTVLRIVSCNVQKYQPDFSVVLDEIAALSPDVVVFQEAFGEHPLLAAYFQDWHTVHVGEFWIGSKYRVHSTRVCESALYERQTAVQVVIDGPSGPFQLTDVHQMTPRRGFSELSLASILTGEGPTQVDNHYGLRDAEADVTQLFVAEGDDALPALVVGDFNAPTSSNIYQSNWGDWVNAFEVGGWGCGYTSPCRPHRFWLKYVPWVRIDHILTDERWRVHDCRVGVQNGSDHRLITATVSY